MARFLGFLLVLAGLAIPGPNSGFVIVLGAIVLVFG